MCTDEEDYFREGDDDEDEGAGPPGSSHHRQGDASLPNGTGDHSTAPLRPLAPLVDYDDDDEQEEDASGFLGESLLPHGCDARLDCNHEKGPCWAVINGVVMSGALCNIVVGTINPT